MTTFRGYGAKLQAELIAEQVHYYFIVGSERIFLNELVRYPIKLSYLESAACISCGRKIKKTFQQGYCFPCVKSKAACDLCIVRPELCHFHLNTCREPLWGEAHCMQDHFVYLANASGIKVGITRYSNIPARFIDQGAVQALPIFKVKNRRQAGLIEVELAKTIADKTNWRKMLMPVPLLDLIQVREALLTERLISIFQQQGQAEIQILDSELIMLNYPISEYPEKIKSIDLLQQKTWEAPLLGIKGQYLLFRDGVLNVRNLSGYAVELSF